MVDTSELLRVFGPLEQPKGEHHSGQVSWLHAPTTAHKSEMYSGTLTKDNNHLDPFNFSNRNTKSNMKKHTIPLEKKKEKKN